jgi:hypothetical protein
VIRVWVGIGVMGFVLVIVRVKLLGYAKRRGYESYYQLRKNASGAAGFVAVGLGVPVMGEIGGLFFLLPAAVAVGLFLWWYGDR